jgi:hypothetical protein
MIPKVEALAEVELGEGFLWFFMKPKLLAWNVRGLNEGDKCLRVRNMLREWKADVIYLQETKLDHMPSSLVSSFWGCQHMNGCCLNSRGPLGWILHLWDRRMVEKLEECVGSIPLLVLLGMLIEGSYEMNWLRCVVCVTWHGALGEDSTSLVFLARDQVKPVCVHLWSSYISSFTLSNNRDLPSWL